MRLSQSALAAFTHARRSAPSYDTVPLPSLCARRSDEKRGLNCDPSNRHVSPSGPRLRPSAAGRVSAPRHDIRNPLSRRATQHAFAHKTSPAAGHLHLLRLGIDRIPSFTRLSPLSRPRSLLRTVRLLIHWSVHVSTLRGRKTPISRKKPTLHIRRGHPRFLLLSMEETRR